LNLIKIMAISAKVYNQTAEAVGEIKLADNVFGLAAKETLIHQALIAQTANQRQVLAHTKTRGEVRGGGKKPWRQKGTGRARAGSSRSPIWIGGGVTFGPLKERNFKKDINKKMKQKAIRMVISDRFKNNALVVLDDLKLEEFKTKEFNEIIKQLEQKILQTKPKVDKKSAEEKKARPEKRSLLIINDKTDEKIKYSGRNLPNVKIINLDNINIIDLLKYKNLVLTKKSVKKLEEKYDQKSPQTAK